MMTSFVSFFKFPSKPSGRLLRSPSPMTRSFVRLGEFVEQKHGPLASTVLPAEQSTQKSTSLQSFSWQSTVLKTMRSKFLKVVFAILIAAGNCHMCPYREIQYPQHLIPTVVKLKSLKFIVHNITTEAGKQ